MKERRGSSAASRAAASAIIVFPQRISFLVNAAEGLQVAAPAGLQVVLRVDPRLARGESGAERLGVPLPRREELLPVLVPLHLRQEAVGARVADEAHVARHHLGEGHRGEVLRRGDGVERELWIVGARPFPLPGVEDLARLVVDEHVAAVGGPVHAVDAGLESQARNLDGTFLFRRYNFEGLATRLDLEPFARELGEALALQLRVAAFETHLLHRRGGGLSDRGAKVATERSRAA